MSSIWTPGGEHEVPRDGEETSAAGRQARAGASSQPADQAFDPDLGDQLDPADPEVAEQLQAMQEQLLHTPAAIVIANHAFGLFELAALHLGAQPPQLGEAQLAIDALGALVEGLTGRLGEYESQLAAGLSQLRLAYVQIRAAAAQTLGTSPTPPGDEPGEG